MIIYDEEDLPPLPESDDDSDEGEEEKNDDIKDEEEKHESLADALERRLKVEWAAMLVNASFQSLCPSKYL